MSTASPDTPMRLPRTLRSRLDATHPMLRGHRVFGTAVLPGLAYIDIVYQLAVQAFGLAPEGWALRRLAIHAPLAIEPGSTAELAFAFTSDADGWRIEVHREDAAARLLATVQLHPQSWSPGPSIDPDALRAAASERIDLARIYADARTRGLEHSGLMQATGEIHVCGRQRLVHLRAAGPGAGMQLLWHPALVDGAAMATEALRAPDDINLYLPLFYESFSGQAPLHAECYALICADAVRSVQDIHSLNIDFYDTQGRHRARLHGITSKRVRAADHVTAAARAIERPFVPAVVQQPARSAAGPMSRASVLQTLREIVAPRLDVAPTAIDASAGFFQLGLQSSQLLGVVADIETRFVLALSPTLLFEHANLDDVARHLLDRLTEPGAVSALPGTPLAPASARPDRHFPADDVLLADHRVFGRPALMGIVHPSLLLELLHEWHPGTPVALRSVVFHGGPIMAPAEGIDLHIDVRGSSVGEAVRVLHLPSGTAVCEARVALAPDTDAINADALWSQAVPLDTLESERLYSGVPGFELGPSLRTIVRAARLGSDTLLLQIRLSGGRAALDPRLLAACYFLHGDALPVLPAESAAVPLAIESISFHGAVPESVTVVTRMHTRRDALIAFDATAYADDGRPVLQVRNASLAVVRGLANLGPSWSQDAAAPAPACDGVEPVAIIGLSGRYPLAADLDAFWDNLAQGRDCIREIPAERWDWREYYSSDPRAPGRVVGKWGGFIDNVDRFAPLFFAISPREAAGMDPQERLFLEESWNALEDAGYTRAALAAHTVGVYVGVMSQEYPLHAGAAEPLLGRVGLPSGTASIANRVSYCFDLRGPSMSVDTMCSSSLTAIALACDALRAGSIDAALAGGVNVSIHPNKYLMLGQGGFLSSQGHCGSFGSGSGGYVPGEGVGVAVLKRLRDAVRDGDRITGVIRGIAVNHGGRASGYAVPNPRAQHAVISLAWRQAGIDASQIDYIEAHGTGTVLGDPIEIDGLARAMRDYTGAQHADPQRADLLCADAASTRRCAIGSVKSNIGHLESAAGIAALSKVLLQMRHGSLVPSLHCETLNPNIDFERSPFVVQRGLAPWPRRIAADGRERPRLAAVSSFGAGGSNAHLVLEEFIAPATASVSNETALVLLSARTTDELRARVRRLQGALDACSDADLPSIAWTLQVGREAMPERLALVVESIATLRNALRAWLDGAAVPGLACAQAGDGAMARFADDDALMHAVQRWAQRGELAKLGDWWTHGGQVDWRVLYPSQPRRIGLPGYPFTRQRCWIGDSNNDSAPMPEPVYAVTPVAGEIVVFHEVWDEPVDAPGSDAWVPADCLLWCDDAELQPALLDGIAARWPGCRISLLVPGAPAAADATAVELVLLVASVPDGLALRMPLQALLRRSIAPRRVLYAATYAADAADQACQDAQEAMLRSVATRWRDVQLGSLVVRDRPLPVTELVGVLLDSAAAAQLASSRWHAHGCRRRRIVQATLPDAAALPFKAGGCYLVTGGFGALGDAVAHYLAETVGARLVLVGRSPLDASREQRLRALDAMGGGANYLRCDVADADALHTAIVASGLAGQIRGVVHAAGVAGRIALVDSEPVQFAADLSAKLQGTLAIEAALAHEPLDFICSFSSLAGVLGDLGNGAYAAGNRFQTAFARLAPEDGVRRVAIQWPLWRDGGMAMGDAGAQALYLASTGQQALDTEAALALLPALLAPGDAAPIVLRGEPRRLQALLEGRVERSAVAMRTTAAPQARAVALDGSGSLVRQVEEDLRGIVQALLHIAPGQFGRRTNFADLGFDSITLQEFARRLGERYALDAVPALFFDHSTVERLAAHLCVNHAAQMAALFVAMEHLPAAAPAAAPKPAPVATLLPTREATSVDSAIAIVGMSGRTPQARDLRQFWQLLVEGRDAIEEIPPQRFEWQSVYQAGAVVPGKTCGKWGGILPGADEFDPLFFGIAPREAAQIDPRQRLLLQEAYRALEDAGHGPQQLKRMRVGVFVGVEAGAYQGLAGEQDTITGNHEAVLAARLSYFLDLSGPNLAINTACSSGLVAMHQACLSLRAGECDSAVAAAANLLLAPESFIGMSQTGMLSPDGRCFSFDARANGMVPGEAVVALVLRRAADALADGDPIHALVRGSGINHDGRTNGLTAPSGRAQQRLLHEVYDAAGIDVRSIGAVIAHGTATPLGDQIELRALCEVFATRGADIGQCALTSTKASVGHTFAPSGLVSVVAMVQAMRHGVIPRSLHCNDLIADVRWSECAFVVPRENRPWPAGARCGAVSAFGMSGTNAHVVLEAWDAAAPRSRPSDDVAQPALLVLSAASNAALRRRADDLAHWLRQSGSAPGLHAVAATLLHGRHHHRCRLALLVDDEFAAMPALDAFGRGDSIESLQCLAFRADVARDVVLDDDAQARFDALAAQAVLEPSRAVLEALARDYCAGAEPQALPHHADGRLPRLHLPGYSFERERYWIARSTPAAAPPGATAPVVADGGLADRVVACVLDHLGVEADRIGLDDPLDEYGLDSVGAARLLTQLRTFAPQTPESLFLEHTTLAALRACFAAMPQPALSQPEPEAKSEPAGAAASIIGLASLLPGVVDRADFWQQLCDERVVTGPLPAARRRLLGIPKDAAACDGAFLVGVECFDRERFRMSPDEARAADPQLRKLIEVTWQALADSGYTRKQFGRRSTGVFVATSGHSGYREIPGYVSPGVPLAAGEGPALYANRLSNLFDLKGPSVVVDAGCAGVLVAIQAALAALAAGQCEQAIVACAQMYLSPHMLLDSEPGPLYSRQGRTRSFARDSDGYVRGEAVGAIVLKPRAAAFRDGDAVHAHVLGAGVWHGGKSPLKWYSPNIAGQRAAIRAAFAQAGIASSSIDYVETEANGSQLGDASEIMAIQAEYAERDVSDVEPLYIGSLKPLCGHAEAAAAFPALLKLVLALQHRCLLGVPDPGELNEGIEFRSGLALLTGARPWPASVHPRRAALHSLSVGGVNAHVVLEEAEPPPPAATPPRAHVFVFSAPTGALLRREVTALLSALEVASFDPHDVASTLQSGREVQPVRLALVADSLPDLCRRLRVWLADGVAEESGDATLAELASRWTAGATIDWERARGAWRRVHLPPPPLDDHVYWHSVPSAPFPPPVHAAPAPQLLQPRWIAQPVAAAVVAVEPVAAQHWTVFCDWLPERFEEFRQAAAPGDGLRCLGSDAATLADRFRVYARAAFGMVQNLLAEPGQIPTVLQLVLPSGLEQVGLHGLVGLLRTAAYEHPRFRGQLVVLDRSLAAGEGIAALRVLRNQMDIDYVQLDGRVRWTQVWEPLAHASASAALSGDAPTVLITGGLDDLGLDLAEHVLLVHPRANVVLTGHSRHPAPSERVARLRVSERRLHYLHADLGDAGDVQRLIGQVLERCGGLDGVIHCAGTGGASFIVDRRKGDIDAVLLPQVAGLYHLDEATCDLPLAFVVALSHLGSLVGGAGAADAFVRNACMTNAFMDAFAAYRNQRVCFGERSGRTLSINWPHWSGGDARPDDAERCPDDSHGAVSTLTSVCIDTLMSLLDGPATQVAVRYGHSSHITDQDRT